MTPAPERVRRIQFWASPAAPVIAVLLAACGGCDPGAALLTGTPAAAPDDRLTHDAGVVLVPPGGAETVRHTFRLTNPAGAAPATLRLLGRSCGCTAVDIEPAAVPPGRSAAVTLRYDVTAGSGETANRAEIGGLPGGPVTLTLLATGTAAVQIEPATLRKALRPGATETIGLTVVTHEPADAPPAAVSLDADSPLFRVADRYPLAGGTTVDRHGAAVRTRRTHFVCEVFGDGAGGRTWPGPGADVPLTASCGDRTAGRVLELRTRPWVVARPARVLFYNAGPGAERTVSLTADRPFRVTAVTGGDGIVSAVPEATVDAPEQAIAVRLAAGAAGAGPGEIEEAVLTVATTHPGQPRILLGVLVRRPAAPGGADG